MFRALSPNTIGVKAELAAAIELAARHGWQGVELSAGEAAQMAAERSADEVAALFARAGLRPSAWGLSIDWRRENDQARLDRLGGHAALARRLGCPRAYTWLPPISDELPFRENFAFHVAHLRPLAQVLAEHGCRLGLEFIGPRTVREPHRYGFIYSLEGMLCLAQAIGPNVGLLLDSYHWYTSLGTPGDIRALRAEDVVHVHINDAPAAVPIEAQLDLVRRLPGATGVIDLIGFLTALREIGYDGPVTPEPFDQHLETLTPDEATRITHDHLLAVWRRAGLED